MNRLLESLRLRLAMWKLHRAQARLQRLVAKQRESFAVQDFAKRRAAALKHTRGIA